MKNGLSKEQSKMLQGLAILMMLYHHLFSTPEALGISYTSLLHVGPFNIELRLAWFFKICVGIYAFVSGYGLTKSLSNFHKDNNNNLFSRAIVDYKFVIKKYLCFYLQFLLVFIIFVPIGFIFFNKPFILREFLLNILGLSSSYNGAWWYVMQYLKMILTLPIIDCLLTSYQEKSQNRIRNIILLILSAIVCIIFLFERPVFNIILDFFQPSFYFCFIMGVIICRFKLYELANLLFPSGLLKCLGILGFILVILARIKIAKDASSAGLDFIFVPVFAFGFSCITECVSIIKKPLLIMGECSTFMWLTHVFFYDHYAKNIVMFSHFSTLIYITLLVLSFLSAVVLNIIYKSIYRLLSPKT